MKTVGEYRAAQDVSHPKNGAGNEVPQLIDFLINAYENIKSTNCNNLKLNFAQMSLRDAINLLGINVE